MEDFIYRDKHNIGRGFIGTLQHKSYNCFIQIYKKVFYVMGVDSSKVPISEEILNLIKDKQNANNN